MSGNGSGSLWVMPKNTTIASKVYLDVLKEKLHPSMTMLGSDTFQQDGAPVHTAKIVKKWFSEKNIKLLDWPGSSPDLNVIENCWMIVKNY